MKPLLLLAILTASCVSPKVNGHWRPSYDVWGMPCKNKRIKRLYWGRKPITMSTPDKEPMTPPGDEYLNNQIYGAAVRICWAYAHRGSKSKEEVIAAVLLNVHLLESRWNVYKKVVIAFEDTGFDPKKIIEESAKKKS